MSLASYRTALPRDIFLFEYILFKIYNNKYMLSNKILMKFREIGNACFTTGLNYSHSGNISLFINNKIYITRRGVMKGFLKGNDIVCVKTCKSNNDYLASSEIGVHRAIYKATDAKAIIHTHPPITIAMAFIKNQIKPIDLEGKIILPTIPVLKCRHATASRELEEKLPPLLKKYHSVIIKKHGVFSIGKSLGEAFHYASLTEYVSKVLYYTFSLRNY
jgi:L-fuculose-phosphate aldolase